MITGFENYNEEVRKFKSSKHYPANMHRVKEIIQAAIKKKPVLSRDIEKAVEIPGTVVRQIISYLRSEEHQPICSGGHGYFWGRSVEEIDGSVKHLEERAFRMHRAAKGLRLSRPSDQMEIL